MKNSRLNIVLLGLLVGTGVFLIVARKSSNSFRASLTQSLAKGDSLTTEERSLEQRARRLKSEVDSLEAETRNLTQALTKSKTNLTVEDHDVIRLTDSFQKMNKECDDFLGQRKQWDQQRAAMQSTNARIREENMNLTLQLLALSQKNQQLNAELALARLFEKDNISIARLDKNDQPIVSANKIKKIRVSMSLPSKMKSPVFKIFDSSGKLLPDQSGSFTSNFSSEANLFGSKASRLELTYSLSKKVGSGSYRVEIDDEGKQVGNVFMNFR